MISIFAAGRTISVALLQRLFLITILLFLLIGGANAQTRSITDSSTPLALAPGAPAGSYALSGFDNINPYNGNLNFRLPLMGVGGRGEAQYTMMLPIEQHWTVYHSGNPDATSPVRDFPQYNAWNSIQPGYGPGVLTGRQVSDRGCSNVNASVQSGLTRLTFITPDGTEYELLDQLTGGAAQTSYCASARQGLPGASRGTVFKTVDGTAATFVSDTTIYDVFAGSVKIYPSGYLTLRNGLRYRIDGGLVTWIRDRNGNKLNFTYTNGGLTTITDSLNRQVTFASGISFKGFGGAPRTIRVSYTSLSNALRTTQPGDIGTAQTYYQLFPQLNAASSSTQHNPTVVSAVWLPDTDGTPRRYQFFYNVYGELARVVLPTGGAYEYDYGSGIVNGASSGVFWADSCGGTGANEIYRRVIEKRVYSDGSTLESWMTFSRPEDSLRGNLGYIDTDRLGPAGTLLARERHYYYGRATASFNLCPFDYSPWQDGREYQTEALNADGATVLRRVAHTWQQASNLVRADNPRIIETLTTLVDTNQVTKQTAVNPQTGALGFDQFNNPTDTWEYDYGVASPGPLLRRVHTDYLTTNPINGLDYTSTNIHIRSLPTTRQVFDASGIERSRTSYEYDNYTADTNHAALVDRPGISGFDSTCTTGYTTRGNVTASTSYLLTSGSVTGSITAYAQFDIAGNVIKAIDARGYATTFDFTDRFGAPDGEARFNTAPLELSSVGQSSYAFATLVTSPPPQTGQPQQTAYAQFDYYLGRPVDGEDPNGIVASGYYNDVLDRPTQVIRAANNLAVKSQTSFSYDDVNRVITTTSDQNTFNDNALKVQTVYDGLGRTVESRQYEGGTNYIAAQTQYDALGRAYRVSNPFRPLAPYSETPLWTTNTFDALGRVTSVTTPDVAVVTTSYSGNTVTVTDQTGKQRKSVTDGLGRLIQVYEDPAGVNYLTSYSYDALDDLTTVTQNPQPPRNFLYDSLKRLTSATNPESGTISYQYDDNGNLLQKTDPRLLADNQTHVAITYDYDALNRVRTRTYNDGTPAVTYAYDSVSAYGKGRLASVSSSVSGYSYSGYDALGRALGGTQTIGSQNYSISNVVYDLAGHVTSMTYPSQHVVNYNYDNAGRLADKDATHLAFTGNLGDGTTTRTYSSIASPNAYDAASRLIQEQFRTTTPIYNKLAYNTRGQLAEIRASTSGGDDSFNRGKIVNDYSDQCSGASCNGTDNNGNLKKQTVFIPNDDLNASPTWWYQQYNYDSLNRLGKVREFNSSATLLWQQAYLFDRYGNRTIDQANTTSSLNNTQFDTGEFALSNRLYAPGDTSLPMSQRQMRYDAAGNLAYDAYTGQGTRTYDAENRMKQAWANNQWQTYSYDGDGHRVKRSIAVPGQPSPVETWQVYGLGGELIAEYAQNGSAASPQKEYGYRNGQLLVTATVTTGWGSAPTLNDNPLSVGQTTVQARHITELRDAINALRSHMNLSAYSWQYSATTNDYISANPILEMRTALDQALGAPSGGYSTGLGQNQLVMAIHIQELRNRVLAAWQSGSGVDIRWMVTDQLGTPRMIFDQSGSLANVSRHDYLPFGEELFAGQGGRTQSRGYTLSDNVRQKFTDKERDSETGLDYFINRYYSSSQGRFTSPDPLGGRIIIPQSLNRYLYVLNNPLRLIDPVGLKDKDPWDQLTPDQKQALEGKLSLQQVKTRTGTRSETTQEAFDRMIRRGASGDRDIRDRIDTVKNFIASAGGYNNDAEWQQITTITNVSVNAVTVYAANNTGFLDALENKGYQIKSRSSWAALKERLGGTSGDHPGDSARSETQSKNQIQFHYAQDHINDPSYGDERANIWEFHFDFTSSNTGSLSEDVDGAILHRENYWKSPDMVRRDLIQRNMVPASSQCYGTCGRN